MEKDIISPFLQQKKTKTNKKNPGPIFIKTNFSMFNKQKTTQK
jgi:hypothetical protein